ncbi:MAG: helix-turn-helix domain-containing protein [Clostridiales bacterium]
MLEYYHALKEIKSAISDYEMATSVNCYLFDGIGKKVGNRSCYECADICNYIKQYDKTGVCVHDYVCNCKQTLVTTDAHYYLCPYGLLNITVPVFLDDDNVYFASTGPILIHEPNKYIVNNFLDRNELLNTHYSEIDQLLNDVPLKDTSHIRALSNVLQKSIQNVPGLESTSVNYNEKQNQIGTLINELKKQIRTNIYPDFNQDYFILEREIELLKPGGNLIQSQKALEMILYKFIDRIHKHNVFEESKYRAARFFYTLLQIAKKRDLNLETIFGKQCVTICDILTATNNEQLNQALYNTVPRFQQAFWNGSKYRVNDIIFQALEYINKNYMDISLQKLASEVALNPTYLSNLIKKQTGQTYSDHLNKVRIEASKQYLRDDMPLAQIASSVGFNDQSYFIKMFKRCEGVSPSKWKE